LNCSIVQFYNMASIKFRLREVMQPKSLMEFTFSLGRSNLKLVQGLQCTKDWNTPDKDNPKKGDNFLNKTAPKASTFNSLKVRIILYSMYWFNLNNNGYWYVLAKCKINQMFESEVIVLTSSLRVWLINHTIHDDNASTRTVGQNNGTK
jgi:hypothetical protein